MKTKFMLHSGLTISEDNNKNAIIELSRSNRAWNDSSRAGLALARQLDEYKNVILACRETTLSNYEYHFLCNLRMLLSQNQDYNSITIKIKR